MCCTYRRMHLLEAAALLAGHQRGRVDAGEQVLRLEGLRERRARPHPVVHVVRAPPGTPGSARAAQDVERLHERQPRLEQRRQLLIEDQELGRRDAPPPRQASAQPAQAEAAAADREQVQALLLEFAAQPRLALGDVRAPVIWPVAVATLQRNSTRQSPALLSRPDPAGIDVARAIRPAVTAARPGRCRCTAARVKRGAVMPAARTLGLAYGGTPPYG